jgi:hypothetical protein
MKNWSGGAGPAKLDADIAVFSLPKLRERTPEHRHHRLRNRIALRKTYQHANQLDLARVLRYAKGYTNAVPKARLMNSRLLANESMTVPPRCERILNVMPRCAASTPSTTSAGERPDRLRGVAAVPYARQVAYRDLCN